ncbi:MAG TPA: hypothetical protein VJ642_01430 [Chromobacteriaceae bacterium]|nr:hypothetical protein [Chromobacteriaceae bacterium]
MKTLTTALLALALSLPAWAVNRVLPATVQPGLLQQAEGKRVAFLPKGSSNGLFGLFASTGNSYTVAPGLRIIDENNRMLLMGRLPALVGRQVGVTFDLYGNINRIWLLTDDEWNALNARQ